MAEHQAHYHHTSRNITGNHPQHHHHHTEGRADSGSDDLSDDTSSSSAAVVSGHSRHRKRSSTSRLFAMAKGSLLRGAVDNDKISSRRSRSRFRSDSWFSSVSHLSGAEGDRCSLSTGWLVQLGILMKGHVRILSSGLVSWLVDSAISWLMNKAFIVEKVSFTELVFDETRPDPPPCRPQSPQPVLRTPTPPMLLSPAPGPSTFIIQHEDVVESEFFVEPERPAATLAAAAPMFSMVDSGRVQQQTTYVCAKPPVKEQGSPAYPVGDARAAVPREDESTLLQWFIFGVEALFVIPVLVIGISLFYMLATGLYNDVNEMLLQVFGIEEAITPPTIDS